jgi:UMF1 family MFS transporter
MADYSGKKKLFMKIFAYVGGISCIGLYFFDGSNVELGIILSITASLGYSGSLVFYDAFLPEISSPDRFDMVSAKGYSLGYFGSILLLLLNLFMLSSPGTFGLSDGGMAAKISFLLVGVWWIGFSQIPFYYLPDNVYNRPKGEHILKKGYVEVMEVWKSLRELTMTRRFLIAFFFYNMGVQTVMYLAALFGDKALNMPGDKLIMTILIIQIVAIGGSYFFAYVSRHRGNQQALVIQVFIWIMICISAYFVNSEIQFYALAFVVGLVMGGIQALSRATYSKLIPVNTIRHASYFSFYDVAYNLSVAIGTFSYGLIEHITGSMRNSALALAVFFMIGLIFLFRVRVEEQRVSEFTDPEVN